MDEKKLRKLIEEKLGNLKEEDIQKIEKYLSEEKKLRRQKIERIKEMIEKGQYNVPPEKVAEKILEYLKKKS
ncbi:flagellar biosynthesis anti-sigma factor FlgM [Persephonella sp.]|uniref:flagellar biosynthesis anti-sigma factor FlgM n=1 Tax=Persephonella sp. TaxID=2060922 RepID=UPI0026347233|nr:flagellar biosynthesis anti-sigma factor FlgM [Persephonella sp.]